MTLHTDPGSDMGAFVIKTFFSVASSFQQIFCSAATLSKFLQTEAAQVGQTIGVAFNRKNRWLELDPDSSSGTQGVSLRGHGRR